MVFHANLPNLTIAKVEIQRAWYFQCQKIVILINPQKSAAIFGDFPILEIDYYSIINTTLQDRHEAILEAILEACPSF